MSTPTADAAEAIIERMAAGNRLGLLTQPVIYRELAQLLRLTGELRAAEQFRDEAVAFAASAEHAGWQRRLRLRSAGANVVDLSARRGASQPGHGGLVA
jgi:hypothetical protein